MDITKLKYKLAFMGMAKVFAQTSEAKRLQVGALIVKNKQIISTGVNGTPAGWETNNCENSNNETEWFVRHAEVQALNKLRKSHETSTGAEMYITHSPCKNCAVEIIDAGITKVYYDIDYRDSTGIELLKKYGIQVEKLQEVK